jgi:MFS transporter, SP family, solute carrier family 2 (myo-inositol transporter), member 13
MYAIEKAGRRKLLLASMAGVLCTLAALSSAFRLSELHTSPVSQDVPDSLGQRCPDPTAGGATCTSCIHQGCVFCVSNANKISPDRPGFCLRRPSLSLCTPGNGYEAFVDGCPSRNSWLLLGLVMAYLLAFAVGMGPVPWAVNSEIYAMRFRGSANGVAGTANWLANGLVSQFFLLFVHVLHAWGAFALLAVIAALGMVWVFQHLPETQGLSLNEVQDLFVERLARSSWRWIWGCFPIARRRSRAMDSSPLCQSSSPDQEEAGQQRRSQSDTIELENA